MIKRENYYEIIKGVDFRKMDADMNAMKIQVDNITINGSDWTAYENNTTVKETFDLYFQALALELEDVKPEKSTKIKVVTPKPKSKAKTKSTGFNAKAQALYAQFTYTIIEPLMNNWFIHNGKLLTVKKSLLKLADEQKIYSEKDYRLFVNTGIKLHKQMVDNKDEISYSTRQDWFYFTEQFKDFLRDAEKILPKAQKTPIQKKSRSMPIGVSKKIENPNAKKVEAVSLELKFIKRYVNMNDKPKTRNQIRLFINALQKAIRERKITKTSAFAKEITEMQKQLILLFGSYKNDNEIIRVSISEKIRTKYLTLVGKQIEMLSVKMIKSYINLQGKIITNKKAHSLHTRIVRAHNSGKVTKKDKYWGELETIMDQLAVFIEKNPSGGILRIEPRALNGLSGIVGCACDESLDGVMTIPNEIDINAVTKHYLQNRINESDKRFFMSSENLEKIKFEHIGLLGKWRDFIGDPAVSARIAVYGAPKLGKSYLMIEFAGYLARNIGTVLYIAREEGKSATLKQKLLDTQATHPDMYVSDYIPETLEPYDFVFFDSVTKLKLTPENLMALKWAFSETLFVEIHQVTKDGKARGLNDFIHDADSIIELTEKGKAVQNGRYNQGGEMLFFDGRSLKKSENEY